MEKKEQEEEERTQSSLYSAPDYNPTKEFQGKDINRSYTPETDLPFFPTNPDISINCEKCGQYVNLQFLKKHRFYHTALTTLHYVKEQPKTVEALLQRRNAILKKMMASGNQESSLTLQKVEKVNDAYEYLKVHLDGTFEELRQFQEEIDTEVSGIGLNCNPDCALAIGIAASENKRWKNDMEDTRTYQDCFGEDADKCYFALFDGHQGRFAAEVAASELHRLLLNEMAKFDPKTKSMYVTNLAEKTDLSQYSFHRPNTSNSERVQLHDESVNIVDQIINLCESKYKELIKSGSTTPGETDDSMLDTERTDLTTDSVNSAIKQNKNKKSPFTLKMEHAFQKAYYLLDILLSYGKDEKSRVRWSGCSALSIVIQNTCTPLKKVFGELGDKGEDKQITVSFGENKENKDEKRALTSPSQTFDPPKEHGLIYLANAGNVQAVLVRGNHPYLISKEHTPSNLKERNRVLKSGGTLSESTTECRVNGVLCATRGLGNHGDKKLKECVLVEPYTACVPIDQYAQFLFIATKGVWDVFSVKEAANLLKRKLESLKPSKNKSLLPSNQLPVPSVISSTLRPLLEEVNTSQRVSFSETEGSDSSLRDENDKGGTSGNSSKPHSLAEIQEVKREGQRSRPNSKISMQNAQEDLTNQHKANGEEFNHSMPLERLKLRSGPTQTGKKNLDFDMLTEIGSQKDQEESGDESGNEADFETYEDGFSMPNVSQLSQYGGFLTQEQYQREFAKRMAEHLVQAALLAGAKDNITVMVVLLPGCGL
ncbi:hypothetical protein CHS0354_008376 [Potamilus streckersoni]|uniref:PPM-type phosphatase domain-containing protein n=1 Tax=Potamilus streckersoni TaxID=2493646 RepID=A0AAE0RPD3_9BIVA|nr:hypothetical protein CHS0354_008376 [Potamilus streckersoni]